MMRGNIEIKGARPALPSAFLWRRWHSALGIWLVLFLIVHLLTNSQAALFIGDDGRGFINGANALESIPYLPIVEAALLAVPLLIHLIWGIKYLFTAHYNNARTDGSAPMLPEYGRNRAYTWQRVTAWLLILGIAAHVIHMRFIERPQPVEIGGSTHYQVQLTPDAGLGSVAERLNVKLTPKAEKVIVATASDFGTAELLMVRNTFKQPIMLVLYTLLVLATCYHAFNGLWTAMIKWGVTLTPRSQLLMLRGCYGMMTLVAFLGLAAVWGTYWINLKS
jgi:succinate dehydrogenase / fumarate reductase, cytochrome b subunit